MAKSKEAANGQADIEQIEAELEEYFCDMCFVSRWSPRPSRPTRPLDTAPLSPLP